MAEKKGIKLIGNIDYEVSRVEDKVKEYQDYLEKNTIITKVKDNKLEEADDSVGARHKEIEVQIKIMDALLRWLPLLKNLKEEESKKQIEVRGDSEINPMFKKRLDQNNE